MIHNAPSDVPDGCCDANGRSCLLARCSSAWSLPEERWQLADTRPEYQHRLTITTARRATEGLAARTAGRESRELRIEAAIVSAAVAVSAML